MKRAEAIERAICIANLITEGVRRLRRKPLKDIPLLAWLPLLMQGSNAREGKNIDVDSLNPQLFEILIFGSVARGEEEVGDIDMIVLDSGFFSRFFANKDRQGDDDSYGLLAENLSLLLSGWLDYSEEAVESVLCDMDVDLHVLPLRMFEEEDVWSEIARKHHDPLFLQNAFSSVLRFHGGKFISTDIAYLKNRCEMERLQRNDQEVDDSFELWG